MSDKKVSFAPEVEDAIQRFHDDHPEPGHEGILNLLEDEGIEVDEYQLRIYMDDHKMDPGPTATWKSSLFGRFKPFGWGLLGNWRNK